MSSVKRPMPRRDDGFGAGGEDGFSRATIVTSCMIHHGSANRLAVSGPVEFGHDPSTCHDADPVGESKDFVEIFTDEHDRSPTIASGQQPLVHGGTSPHVKPAARAVRYDYRRLPAELARYYQLLGVAAR